MSKIFLIWWVYSLLGFSWVYIHYLTHKRKDMDLLSVVVLLCLWPLSLIFTLPIIYRLIRRYYIKIIIGHLYLILSVIIILTSLVCLLRILLMNL